MDKFIDKFFGNFGLNKDEIIKTAKEDALKAFKSAETTFDKIMNDFDLETFDTRFDEYTKTMKEEIKKFANEVKEKLIVTSPNPHTIVVRYDRNTDILSYNLNGNNLTIKVKTDCEDCDEQREQTISKTFNFTVDHVEQSYNRTDKTMTFNIVGCDAVEEEVPEETEEEIDTEVGEEEVAQPEMTEEDCINSRIMAMYNDGCSYKAISREVGLSDKTVARRIKKFTSEAYC